MDRKFLKRGDLVRLAQGALRNHYLGAAHSDRGEVVRTDYERKGDTICVRREGIKTLQWYPPGVWELVNVHAEAMDEEGTMLEQCRVHLADSSFKLIYSDWLAERERNDEAAVWRWLGRNNKYPEFRMGDLIKKRWRWWMGDITTPIDRQNVASEPPKHAQLPRALFMAASDHIRYELVFKDFNDRTEGSAIGCLVKGFKRIRELVERAYH